MTRAGSLDQTTTRHPGTQFRAGPARLRRSHGAGRQIALLASATTAAQVLSILGSPFLARAYGPQALGQLGLFTSIVAVIGIIGTFKYELAIPLATSGPAAAALVRLCLIAGCLVGFIASAGVVTYRVVGDGPGGAGLWSPMVYVGVAVAAAAGLQAHNMAANRVGNFRLISVSRIVQSVGALFAQLAGSLVTASPHMLVGGFVLGQATSLAVYQKGIAPRGKRASLRRTAVVARRHRGLAFALVPATALNVVSQRLPLLAVIALYGPLQGGYFFLAERLVSTPLSMVGSSIGQIYYHAATKRWSERGDIASLFSRTIRNVALVALPLALLANVTGERLIVTLLGTTWATTASLVSIISVGAAARLVVVPVAKTLAIVGRAERLTIWEVVRLTNIGLCCLAASVFDIQLLDLALALSLTNVAQSVLLGFISYRSIPR